MKKIFIIKSALFALLGFMALISCKKNPTSSSGNPKVNAIAPDSAKGGDVLTLTGSGLSGIRTIMFEKDSVPASFNPTFNTDGAVIFRVPDTAFGGPQNILFTNASGLSFSVPFRVLAFPGVSTISNYDFNAGDTLTLTGNNLEEVSRVVFTGTTTAINIVSKSHHVLKIVMPSTTISRSTLDITNLTGTITTIQEFVALANAYPIFTDDYAASISNGSWGPATISTSVFKTGAASFAATYQKGNWSADGFANWWPGVPNLSAQGYNYLTFWIKGGSADYTLYLTCSGRSGGYGNSDQSTPLDVPANVWTYYKLQLSSIKLWANGSTFAQLGWWIKGPNSQDETFYFDDVLFVK